MIKNLGVLLARQPVIMAIYGIEQLKTALSSKAEVCIIANIDLIKLQPVIELLSKAGKYVIVNIDSCNGLSQDKGGIDYVAETGAMGLLSTRLQTVQRAKKCGLITMQKIFVTDRSTWLRSLKAVEQSEPDYVQLMPAQMLPLLPQADRNVLPPIVASGFVCNEEHARTALLHGAIAVSSSDSALWDVNLLR
ncbi:MULTISPECIES: glycerol-3-phosphate responsive antiterminator [Citrobacter]|jgi:glycerol uptake operon antiterminator|uniref:Glycerol-3-phosphate responsive antiterminator n=2 Tax=Citrobacter freundii complex TaxID=1344959 RepID=A0A7X1EIL3_9ENTR|nr:MULTISPECIES: glycerol-3-phosphate responsive antiterminator [Citrobacter]MBS6074011.1 glycerol-3-phosphate responsive antiterminator [Citrobacter freundii]GAS72289.1 glycerol-3-phosphate responsive antiterminator [Salmonella enterica]AWS94771.1 glycerol-3-phosphate responsive antiterminator [Citrobacter sp. CRE-46]EGT0640380.1 glycerol-3-phosphate responsive antiterminator [Citrobacter werkmanii]EGT0662976.1 glycerol-3-phosphate responsive antiterminator [Citrobacter werkmanii]